MVEVRCVDEKSPHLAQIRGLWRENAQWLGFFPEGAFAERAHAGQLIGAFCDDVCAAYLVYYTTSSRKVRITHLCVGHSFRGKRLARSLIDFLREQTKNYLGIGLYCCRDFEAWNIWPRLGFVSLHEKPGRGKSPRTLTFYWLEHSHPTLFSSIDDISDDNCLDVAIDANVFYDLSEPSRPGANETRGIIADWLAPSIRLCVTQELSNEIERNPNAAERTAQRAELALYDCPACDTDTFFAVETRLRALLGEPTTMQDAGDRRQLARAIASDIGVFVTRDSGLLDAADKIYDEYGLSVVRPAQLVGQFEILRHEREFQRARLAGTHLAVGRISNVDTDLADAFQNTHAGERRRHVEHKLNLYFSHPDRFTCHSITDQAETPLALYVIDRCQSPHCITIPFFRVANGTLRTRRAGTLANTLLTHIVQNTAQQKAVMLHLTEGVITPPVEDALSSARFIQGQSGWVKFVVHTIANCSDIALQLKQNSIASTLESETTAEIVTLLLGDTLQHDCSLALDIEHLLWPAKLRDCNIPTFIVPIRPRWARELFDAGLANETFFGAKEELALNPNSVYYRHVLPRGLKGTGRLLWYVSGDDRIPGTKRIRACSRLDSIEIGKPKEVFPRYRRFGIFEWRDVLEIAGNSLDGEVMAVKFSDTELFRTPVGFEKARQILKCQGAWNNFQSPIRIPNAAFEELYRQGMSI
ncbi:MAG: GNAT family N-acetyltransferase [Thermoguttaceae bacterium]